MKILLLMVLSLSLCGCQNQKEENKKVIYKDGTYTTYANGYGGSFEVETIISNQQLKDVIVKENNETPSIGGVAIEQMVSLMKKEKTYDVDTVSGATKTSQALKDAVKESFEESKK